MIRINLLGVPKPRRGKRAPAMAMPTGEGPSFFLFAAVAVVIAVIAVGFWWTILDRDARKIAADMVKANQESQRLAAVKTKYEQRRKQADEYERRIRIIDQLRINQSGPVALLATLGDTVNKTDAVWLSNMSDQGNSIALDGTALSTHAVANLMTNMMKTGYFKSVEIKETVQDPAVKEMQAFTFSLVCEKAKS